VLHRRETTSLLARILLIGLGFALLVAPSSGGQWRRLSAPGLEVFSDARESRSLDVFDKLVQIRAAFRSLTGQQEELPVPARIILFSRESDYRLYRPSSSVEGFFREGADRNYIIMHASTSDSRHVAYHEYVHLVLNNSTVRLPQWLEEGICEYYSTVATGPGELVVGKPLRSNLRTLARRHWMNADELSAVTSESDIYDEDERAGIFYAQSWALVHMLLSEPKYLDHLPEYATRLADAHAAPEAFELSFGVDLDRALRDLRRYVSTTNWRVTTHPWEGPDTVHAKVEELSDEQAELVLLDLRLELGMWEVSEKSLRKLARKKGISPEIELARALLAMSAGDNTLARQHFEAAIQLGSRDPSTYFEYAMLLKEDRAPADRVRENLQRTIELSPSHGGAHYILGIMAANEGRHGDSIEPLRKAAAVLPRQSSVWHALALAYHETGEQDLARRCVLRARDAARNRQDIEMADAAMRLIMRKDTWVDLPNRPAVVTPEAWQNAKGDRSVQGSLVKIDCLDSSARLHVRADDEIIALWVADPGKVVLKNLSERTFEFSCGEIDPLQVVIEYVNLPGTARKTAGEVTSIEFQ